MWENQTKATEGAVMSIRGKLIKFMIFTVFFAGALNAGKVSTKVSSKHVEEGEIVRVTLSAKSNDVKFPDIEDVGGFPIFNKGISTEHKMFSDGQTTTMANVKSFSFSFSPEINMTIPSYSVVVDGTTEETKPVKIIVSKVSQVQQKKKSVTKYTLKLSSNKSEVYLGDSCVVDVEFFEPFGSAIQRAEYIAPKFKNANIKVLASDTRRGRSNGTVHIYSYLVSPKHEGEISISAPMVRIGIESRRRVNNDPFAGMFGRNLAWRNIKGNRLKIKVRQQLEDTDLIGNFTIRTTLGDKHVKANEPVEYTVTIEGNGELDSLEDHKFDIPGVTVYGDDAIVTHKKVGKNLVNKYVKKYIFISDNSFMIPSYEVTYFDTQSKTVKSLKSKEQSIVINNQTVSSIKENNTKNPESKAPVKQVEKNISSVLEDQHYMETAKQKSPKWYWWGAYGGVAVLLLGTLYWLFVSRASRRFSKRRYSTEEALRILYPHVGKSAEIEEIVTELYAIKNGKSNVKINQKRLAEVIDTVL